MSLKRIIKMAQEAGGTIIEPFDYGRRPSQIILTFKELERFAISIAKAERKTYIEMEKSKTNNCNLVKNCSNNPIDGNKTTDKILIERSVLKRALDVLEDEADGYEEPPKQIRSSIRDLCIALEHADAIDTIAKHVEKTMENVHDI